jgi:hypothetical protein
MVKIAEIVNQGNMGKSMRREKKGIIASRE